MSPEVTILVQIVLFVIFLGIGIVISEAIDKWKFKRLMANSKRAEERRKG